MRDPKKVVENIIGVVTVGSLIKSYRRTHELTLNQMAKILKMAKPKLQKVESDKQRLSLKEVIKLADKLEEPKAIYAKVWCEEEVKRVGLDFDDLSKVV